MSQQEPTQSAPQIDLAAIKAKIESLSDNDLREALLKLRVREKKTQKRSYGSPNQKKYQQTQRERRKLLMALAREKGIMADIDKLADEQAEEELAAEREAVNAASESEE